MKAGERRSILVVDDSPEDFEVLQWACRAASIDTRLFHCLSGDEAIAFLNDPDTYGGSDAHPPALVILDLNLPKMGGRDLLRYIKTSVNFKSLPVVMFSSTKNTAEIEDCYLQGASGYLVKPLGLEQMRDLIADVHRYWFQHAVLPGPRVSKA